MQPAQLFVAVRFQLPLATSTRKHNQLAVGRFPFVLQDFSYGLHAYTMAS